jgi:electron transport complex protein RnfD/electron transport complex protein RnfC
MCVLGSVFAILIVKQVFGGLGQNFMNPALGARCFLLISFTGRMTTFVYDGVTGATPLALLKYGENVNLMDMLIGNEAGTIGETSVIAILIGALFLIAMGIIDLRIPGTYLASFVVFILLFGGRGLDITYITAHLCGGGLMLGAWFMATDYVTSPITKKGQIVYGICLGVLTGLFRLFGGSAEGVSYAIIISNLFVPMIEKVTLPKPFGKGGEK